MYEKIEKDTIKEMRMGSKNIILFGLDSLKIKIGKGKGVLL